MLEKEIERRVCDFAREKDMMAYKFNSPARAAVPDRMFIFKGIVFFIEFKAKGKLPTSAQNREHERIRSHGAVVFVVDNEQVGKYVISNISLGIHPEDVYSRLDLM